MNVKHLTILFFAAALSLSSCKKDEETPVTPTTNTNTGGTTTTTTPAYFAPADANGILVAGNLMGTGLISAQFFASAGGSARTAAGSVTFNGNNMTLGTDTVYSKFIFTDITSAGANWTVVGNSNVENITATYPDFPSLPSITSSATITRASGCTITFNAVTGADSVYVTITSGSGFKSKLIAGNATSCSFTSTELSGLSTTTSGQINVGAWTRYSQTFNSKKYYFYNNSSSVQTATIQ